MKFKLGLSGFLKLSFLICVCFASAISISSVVFAASRGSRTPAPTAPAPAPVASRSSTSGRAGMTSRSPVSTSSRGVPVTSSRGGGVSTSGRRAAMVSSNRRAASVFNPAAFSAVSVMTNSTDPRTQAESNCIVNYTACMDMLAPYVISQNPFLANSSEVKYLTSSDNVLRFVYDDTPVSQDGTTCGGTNNSCADESKTAILYRNYNYFCSEGGIETARECKNLKGTWNPNGYRCYGAADGYNGAFSAKSSPALSRPATTLTGDALTTAKAQWTSESEKCLDFGGLWSQCGPANGGSDMDSISDKELRRCYFDQTSRFKQLGSTKSTAYYQEISSRLAPDSKNPLKVVNLGRQIMTALGINTTNYKKIGDSNFAFSVNVSPPPLLLNSKTAFNDMTNICFIAKDGSDAQIEEKITRTHKNLSDKVDDMGNLIKVIKDIASSSYTDANNNTVPNACKAIKGSLQTFYKTGMSSVLIKDSNSCNNLLGSWSYCYNADSRGTANDYFSTNSQYPTGQKNCEKNGTMKWDTSKSGYCVWDDKDQTVCELFGGEYKPDSSGVSGTCTTSIKIENANDCEKYGMFWNPRANTNNCYKDMDFKQPLSGQVLRITIGADKNDRVKTFENFETPAQSTKKYEQALQATRLKWKSSASDAITNGASEIERGIKQNEMTDLIADAKLAKSLADQEFSMFESCSEGLDTCIKKDTVCGADGTKCVGTGGIKEANLNFVGQFCYPSYKQCVNQVIKSFDKSKVSPFLAEYITTMDQSNYWKLASLSLASTLASQYQSILEKTCSDAGGFYDGTCYLKVPSAAAAAPNVAPEAADGMITPGENYTCTYAVPVMKAGEYFQMYSTSVELGGSCDKVDDLQSANKKALSILSVKGTGYIPVAVDGNEEGIKYGTCSDRCTGHGGMFGWGSCNSWKKTMAADYYVKSTKMMSSVDNVPIQMNGMTCKGSGTFSPEGWKRFGPEAYTRTTESRSSCVAKGGISSACNLDGSQCNCLATAPGAVKIPNLSYTVCSAMGGTCTVHKMTQTTNAQGLISSVDTGQLESDPEKIKAGNCFDACVSDPKSTTGGIQFSPYNYILQEVMGRTSVWNDAIKEL